MLRLISSRFAFAFLQFVFSPSPSVIRYKFNTETCIQIIKFYWNVYQIRVSKVMGP
ncbi:hypothetical protein Hanom_Chr04g00325791 [Helianthus anomalus]